MAITRGILPLYKFNEENFLEPGYFTHKLKKDYLEKPRVFGIGNWRSIPSAFLLAGAEYLCLGRMFLGDKLRPSSHGVQPWTREELDTPEESLVFLRNAGLISGDHGFYLTDAGAVRFALNYYHREALREPEDQMTLIEDDEDDDDYGYGDDESSAPESSGNVLTSPDQIKF